MLSVECQENEEMRGACAGKRTSAMRTFRGNQHGRTLMAEFAFNIAAVFSCVLSVFCRGLPRNDDDDDEECNDGNELTS
jgi:hypothetical protein